MIINLLTLSSSRSITDDRWQNIKKDNDIACISALKALKLFNKIAVCFPNGIHEQAMDVSTCAKWFYYLQRL